MNVGSAAWLRWLSDYGMLGVLALLCAAFSIATIAEQRPTGAAAARAVAGQIPLGSSVAIIASGAADDVAFAEELSNQLRASGANVAVDVRGEPREARSLPGDCPRLRAA